MIAPVPWALSLIGPHNPQELDGPRQQIGVSVRENF
jgi:hypothetical protein